MYKLGDRVLIIEVSLDRDKEEHNRKYLKYQGLVGNIIHEKMHGEMYTVKCDNNIYPFNFNSYEITKYNNSIFCKFKKIKAILKREIKLFLKIYPVWER